MYLYSIGLVIGIGAIWLGWNLSLDAQWQPTDLDTIHRILSLANLKRGERVYDLGCGDGRVLIEAAKSHVIMGIGVEIDPLRALIAKCRTYISGVNNRVEISLGNMYDQHLDNADVIFLFLSETANKKLSTKLRSELQPETRIVSYFHKLPKWDPKKVAHNKQGYELYLYVNEYDPKETV